jgi:hypothetical protein
MKLIEKKDICAKAVDRIIWGGTKSENPYKLLKI